MPGVSGWRPSAPIWRWAGGPCGYMLVSGRLPPPPPYTVKGPPWPDPEDSRGVLWTIAGPHIWAPDRASVPLPYGEVSGHCAAAPPSA